MKKMLSLGLMVVLLIILFIGCNDGIDNLTVTFDLEKSGNLKIILTDLSGRELFTVYDAFTVEGNFTQTFSTVNLPTGIYFLQILLDGKYTVAKIEVN